MCGLIAYLSPNSNGFNHSEFEIFTQMLFVDSLRGFDSTGVFGVKNNGNVSIHKEASQGGEFIQTNEFKEFRSEMIRNGVFAVGHNRAATRGVINDKNAHPFWVDDKIILVQNGTWHGEHKKIKDVEVDTEVIAHIISENDDVEDAINKINAAYALIWYNVATKQLNIIRNDDRPLYYGKLKNGGVLVSSETLIMQFITLRVGDNSAALEEKPTMISKDKLLQFTLDTQTKSWEETYKEIKIRPKVGASSNQQYRGYLGAFDDEDRPEFNHASRHKYCAPNTYPLKLANPARREQENDSDARLSTDKSFGGLIMEHRPELWTDSVATQEILQNYVPDRNVFLRLEDYMPTNEHKDCRSFYVYGKLSEDNPILVYWLERDKSEEDILNMITTGSDGGWMVKTTSANILRFSVGNSSKSVLSAYALSKNRFKFKEKEPDAKLH